MDEARTGNRENAMTDDDNLEERKRLTFREGRGDAGDSDSQGNAITAARSARGACHACGCGSSVRNARWGRGYRARRECAAYTSGAHLGCTVLDFSGKEGGPRPSAKGASIVGVNSLAPLVAFLGFD